jgi:hypothetical protein
LKAVRAALNEPSEGDRIFFGYNGAVLAFMLHDYDLCDKLCDKMLAVGRNDKWWLRKVLRLQAGATFMKGNHAPALTQMRQAQAALDRSEWTSREENEKSDKEFLLAIQNNNTNFVKDCRNWLDEVDAWDDPYECDGGGWHGRTDIPAPYPKTWPKTWEAKKMKFTELPAEP